MNYHYLLFSCNVFEIQIQDIPGQIAQSVEHGTENPGVAGSIPALPTIYIAQHRCQTKRDNLGGNLV